MQCDDKEIWKPILGYEGLYEISNKGNVKALARKLYMKQLNCKPYYNKPEKILKFDLGLYKRITLCKNNKTKRFLVHRLVAEHFLPNPNNYDFINHIDLDKYNNNISNLEWCNINENNSHFIDKSVTSSRYIGVSFKKNYEGQGRIKQWQAYINVNGKRKYLGLYLTEKEANEAYFEALKKYNLRNKYAKKATN